MEVAINNLQETVEVTEKMKQTVQQVIKKGLEQTAATKYEVSIAFVDNQYIQDLNANFRNQEQATDVLSFPQDDDLLLGDIIISLETAIQQARDYDHSVAREVGFLTVHGLLHLLGYDHHQEAERQTMRQQEEEILAQLGLTRQE